ncbi:lipase family protein [Alteripontixanthobacter maritimus]|uniref:lipase family protein n=1 Tax=Alteripontixanthobacter maritimus TaxID=2161824 RepID=UPI0015F11C14|nr:lipase family protein [Alteripontixanthobacter maritimus]
MADTLTLDAGEWEKGLVLALLCAIAYDTDNASRQRRFARMGFVERGSVNLGISAISGLDAYFLERGDDRIIVFRGSQEAVDWFHNARAGKRRFDGVRVHRGFADSAGIFKGAFLRRRALFTGSPNIWLTGHSLGGAVAQLAAYSLALTGRNIANITTFGAPRVGGPLRWVTPYRSLGLGRVTSRWVNDRDFVPRLPFFVPGIRPDAGWAHTGPQNYIDLGSSTVHFGDTRVLFPPAHAVAALAHHPIVGFGTGETSGYVRNICRLMPAGRRMALQESADASLRESLDGLARLTDGDAPPASSLSAFTPVYRRRPTLAETAIHFR